MPSIKILRGNTSSIANLTVSRRRAAGQQV